jgi:hypothetical protein
MGRPKTKYCPHGHDKEAPHGSYLAQIKTLAGRLIIRRNCAMCVKLRARADYWATKLELPARKAASPLQVPQP